MMVKKAKFRIIAFILLVATLVGVFPAEAVSFESVQTPVSSVKKDEATQSSSPITDKVYVLYNDVQHRVLEVSEHEKKTLTYFVNDIKVDGKVWQILSPDGQFWVNIYGASDDTLSVGHALVSSMLNSEGAAYIRLSVRSGNVTYVSEPVEIRLSYDAGVDDAEPIEQYVFSEAAEVSSSTRESEPDGDNFQVVTIIINYLFDDGSTAFESYGATIQKGSSFKGDGDNPLVIKSPEIMGFEPHRRVVEDGEADYVHADEVEFNYDRVDENITINIIYLPAIVKYKVYHYFQNIYDDEYPIEPSIIDEKSGLNGSVVPENLQLNEENYPGLKSLAYEKIEIAADGSTIVEIRYERYYYLVEFDMQGGFGVEPVYIRFESDLGANQPTRYGYIFNGWELVSYNGNTPTNEQKVLYDINSTAGNTKIIKVPAANLVYRANWSSQIANYTLVFWRENAEDNGFSFWAALDGLTAMSGSLVSAQDKIGQVSSISDKNYFTYMPEISDKDVLVEGDGSTVVNVYYARNRYNLTFKAKGACTIPEKHTHSDDCYTLLCLKNHIHTDDCEPVLRCEVPVHEAHTDSCIICGIAEHTHSAVSCGCDKSEHEHVKGCYSDVGTASTPNGAPTNPKNGQIYKRLNSYYIYLFGAWYRYTGKRASSGDIIDPTCGATEHIHGVINCDCKLVEHTHGDSCYRDVIHTHDPDSCYGYSCGTVEHVHNDGCRVLDCAIATGHTHNNTCKSSSSTNTVKVVREKYGANIEELWPVEDGNGKIYNSGQRWTPSDSSYYSEVLVYIANMPPDDFTLTLSESSNDTYTMNYYLEVLEGESYELEYSGKKFKLYTTVKANYNYLTKAEDFFDIMGYTQFGSNPSFGSNGQLDINGGGTVNMFYSRNTDYNLEFTNNGIILTDKSQYGELPYGSSIKQYYFEPDYPQNLEPNAYYFDGWYTTEGCYPGTEVNWDTSKIGDSDLMFYAKWSPVVHEVKVFLDNTLSQQIGETQYVSHRDFATLPIENITNGNYIFQGWFYSEVIDGKVVEKAFVFTGIPITKDLNIYAKWSSHITVGYTISYVLEGTTTPVAEPTTGYTIAGNNKTFYAKAGSELYTAYQVGYYPDRVSHTVTMSADKLMHEFVFEYTHVAAMPYLVRYVDQNGEDVLPAKMVMDNEHSVVTETFIRVDGNMPDAYQKRLVLSTDSEDADNDGILDANVIVFNYTQDEKHAYYKVVHYIQNIGESGYREYRSEETVGEIGESYSIFPTSITGFSYNPAKTSVTVNGQTTIITPPSESGVELTLPGEGMLVELYYDRVQTGYTVKYVDKNGKDLVEPKKGSGIFGQQILEYALGLDHLGYKLESDDVQQIHLSTNVASNVITFKYSEREYVLSYVIVGSPEGASLSLYNDRVTAVSGTPSGSHPFIAPGFHYDGWYFDIACTQSVPEEWIDPETKHLVPQNDGPWLSDRTYYVQINPDYTDLTITTVGFSDVDEGKTFIFRIQGTSDATRAIDLTIGIVGNDSVTITYLPVGDYSVTSITAWSHRYTPDEVTKNITLSYSHVNSLLFSQLRMKTKWLDGNDYAIYFYN